MSSAADDMAAAEATSEAAEQADDFLAWASRHRRRAARDGAWKVEVSERTLQHATGHSLFINKARRFELLRYSHLGQSHFSDDSLNAELI